MRVGAWAVALAAPLAFDAIVAAAATEEEADLTGFEQ
jgi:hypothetical protein